MGDSSTEVVSPVEALDRAPLTGREFAEALRETLPTPGPGLHVRGPVAPPKNSEVYSYFGPQRRWFAVVMALCYSVVLASMLLFTLRSWAVWVFTILFLVLASDSVLALITGIRKARFDRTNHARIMSSYLPHPWPSVDVYLPTCGEPLDLLANTYQYVAQMQWGGELSVYVLDDGGRDEVASLAGSYGFAYLRRPNRGELKKAGNLRYALTQTHGDHIAILDADFCPRSDYLAHLMPYMDDESVGIVQSPQAFDTDGSMGWVQRAAGAVQEYFYRWVQPSRDRIGAPICVGTCAIYRRAALDACGGIAAIEHSEDIYTGLEMARVGFGIAYVPVVVAKGLCPDNAAGFINQQYRWCLGSVSLLCSKRFHSMPMTRWQRAAYWSGFFYYFASAFNVLFAQLPGLVMLVFFAAAVTPASYLPLFGSLWVWMVLAPLIFETNMRLEFQRVQMLSAFTHAVAILDGFRGQAAAWVPTGAISGQAKPKKHAMTAKVAWLGLVVTTAMLAGVVGATAYDIIKYGFGHYWLTLLMTSVFAYLAIPLLATLWPLAWSMVREPDRQGAVSKVSGTWNIRDREKQRRHISADAGGITPIPVLEQQDEPGADHRMTWPVAAGITATFITVGLIASGVVDSSLSLI